MSDCTLCFVKVYKIDVLYSAVSSPLDRSKHFTIHPLADLFILTPTTKTIHSHFHRCQFVTWSIAHLLSVTRYSFIQLSELGSLGHHGENENALASKQQQRGFEPGLSRLRFRHSTVEQPGLAFHLIGLHSFPTPA